MSWDISVFAAKKPPPRVALMPDGWHGELLGSAAEVRSKISACLPTVDWSDVAWGVYDGHDFCFEFNLGCKDPNDGFMIHVRGSGDAVMPLLQLAERWGWYLLDCSQGEWLHHCDETQTGWPGFKAYRDRVIRQYESRDR